MRRTTVALAAALTCVGAALLVQLASAGSDQVSAPALRSYEARLVPLVTTGGKTVELGVKPGVSDLTSEHIVPPAMIAAEASNWISDLLQVRRQIAALAVTGKLRQINAGFVSSLDRYVAACRTFHAAADATGPRRTALVDRGIAQATAADRLYDTASAQLQALRRQLKLPPDDAFPQPTGGEHP